MVDECNNEKNCIGYLGDDNNGSVIKITRDNVKYLYRDTYEISYYHKKYSSDEKTSCIYDSQVKLLFIILMIYQD